MYVYRLWVLKYHAQTVVHLLLHQRQVKIFLGVILLILLRTHCNPPYYFSCVVHELRPGDIKVVAAVGDSLTVSVLYLLLHESNIFKHFSKSQLYR